MIVFKIYFCSYGPMSRNMIRDAAGGGAPDAGRRGNLVDDGFQCGDAMRLPEEPRVDVQAEHGSGCTTIGMELTEGLKHRVAPDRRMNFAVPDRLDVVPFGLIRDRQQRRPRL